MIKLNNIEFENEIKKELELEAEKQKVVETVDIIKREIRNYIDKRHKLSKHLVEVRKRALEEYKDDEDKLIEYFDHETFVTEESFKAIDRRIKELTLLQSSPYFGRVDFLEKQFDDEDQIYIGRFGLTEENSYEPMVIDWRAPVAALFYAGKLGDVFYNTPMGNIDVDILGKKQFIIKKEKLMGMFDSTIDIKDDILQMVLSKKSSEKLKDIIMTIQGEQDEIIRQPKDKAIVVDGVAGSGKTTIALHRVAYLLYNFRKNLQDKILILGPNKIFMEYISTVLPSLGEIGVKQLTFREFALDILDLNNVMSFKNYMENIINKNEEFTKDMLFKSSEEFVYELDKFIDVLNKKYFKIEDVYFDNKVIVSKNVIEDLFEYYKNMPLFRRSSKVKRILFSKIKDIRDEKVREVEKWYRESLSSLNEDEKLLNEGDLEYRRKIKIREIVQSVIKSKKTLGWIENEACETLYNELNNNKELTMDDLAPILYLKIKLEGLKLDDEIKHVVIDEAQDYSFLQFKVIKELTKANGYTIVGDRNQRILPSLGEIPMLKLDKILENIERVNLNKSYRSTKEIMEYANNYLKEDKIVPIVREGNEVVEKEFKSTEKEKLIYDIENTIRNIRKDGFESIAVVCRNIKTTEKIASLLKNKINIKILSKEDTVYNKGEVVIPSYFAKGLEFDVVIFIDDALEEKMSYVMATRALHQLYVYKIV